jgi:hypothetical protein
MTSQQYESLCRFFIADQLGMRVDEIRSGRVANPAHAGLHEYNHQIDLYWEAWDFLTCHLNIANAKWRGRVAVSLADVLLLRQVQTKVGAHKAVLITNSLFSPQAQFAAEEEGVALLIVRPAFAYRSLPKVGTETIQAQLQERAKTCGPLYTYHAIRKGLEPVSTATLLGGLLADSVAPSGARVTPRQCQLPGSPVSKAAPPPYHGGWPRGGPPGYRTK